MLRKAAAAIFFGNYFYAICAVALATESNLQLGLPLDNWLFYAILFCGTLVYYTKAYVTESYIPSTNIRTIWYNERLNYIKQRQYTLGLIAVSGILLYLLQYGDNLFYLTSLHWFLIFIFPLAALTYYNISFFHLFRFNLRKRGWFKPFIISFVWAGMVTIYPIISSILETKISYSINYVTAWFFIKNWLFIAVLCIMFDIKDYTSDSNNQLKTFVVQIGPRKTLAYIIIPLSIFTFIAFICFVYLNHFPLFRILINSIPFLLLLIVAHSLHKQKTILYYLIIIDGLMLVKALCGIIAQLLR